MTAKKKPLIGLTLLLVLGLAVTVIVLSSYLARSQSPAADSSSPVLPAGAQHDEASEQMPLMKPSPTLSNPIELKTAQVGFAGLTGEIVRIGADGSYSVTRFVNEDREAPHLQGLLDPDQQALLAELMNQAGFQSLSGDYGEAPSVNPSIVQLSRGHQTVRLYLASGAEIDDLMEEDLSASHEARALILAIARHIRQSTHPE